MPANSPEIPLPVLRKMIAELPAAEVAKLPADKLPRRIPPELLEQAPADTALTLETLLLQQQASELAERRSLRDVLGDEGLAAFDLAMHCALTGPVRELNEKIHNHRKFKRTQLTHNSHRGSIILLESLSSHLRLVQDVRGHVSRLLKARQILTRANIPDAPVREMTSRAAEKLLNHARVHCEVLSQYQVERMDACAQVMNGHVQNLQQHASRQQLLHTRIEALELRAESLQSLAATATDRGPLLKQLELVRTEIAKTSTALHSLSAPLDEIDLTEWLDIIVDYALSQRGRAHGQPTYREALANFVVLIQYYYTTQQDVLFAPNRNPLLPVSPERMASYALRSEAFLVGYFRNRLNEKQWHACMPGGNGQAELERIQNEVLSRLRVVPELPKLN